MIRLSLCVLFTAAQMLVYAQLRPAHLLCENLPNPLCIDASAPRLSWQMTGVSERDLKQTAYELRVATDKKFSELTWSTGKIASDSSVQVTYKGQALKTGVEYFWQVRIWDNKGHASKWSEPQTWRMGLLHPEDWTASWIEPGYAEDPVMRPSPLFRKSFSLRKTVKSAIAYITCHGLYEAYLNGQRIGDACLTPGWTSYNKRLQYQAYDVTSLLKKGDNAIGAMLGSGWYRGHLAWQNQKDVYGKTCGLLLQMVVTYNDGTTEIIQTDNTWKSATGEVTYSEIYNGEIIDARKDAGRWTSPGFDDNAWSGVQLPGTAKDNLVATWNEPVRKHEVFHPRRIFRTPKGELVVDFGQNLVGWARLTVNGKAGDSIKLFHAEVLDKEGNFYTANLRVAKAEDIYVLKGGQTESFEPHFTWQGFRYVRVEGFPGDLKPEDIEATALYSDMPRTGTFSCSNALINQLQHNIEWGQRGNFLDVPTDCPQRDERLGWTGDAQVFSRTASFLRGVDNFFAKWLRDVAADQFASGAVPHVVPNVLGKNDGGSTGWSDVATIVPWNMYLAYGDRRILEDQYESMKAWIGFMEQHSKDYLWNTGGHFGDWLSYEGANTDQYLIAQCFFAHSTQLVIDAARVLGRQDDVEKYTALLKNVKDAFLREYATPDGRLISNTQTAYVLALQFDMLPQEVRGADVDRLVQNIRDYHDHLTTGFLGTPYLCHVLSRFGRSDVAYTLLLQDTYPSWLFPVHMGATTIWERWDGQKPDSTFEDPGMNSFNHYAYGAIGDWMYRVSAGIDTYDDAPGYKKIRIMPHLTDKLDYVQADLETGYGLVSSHWKRSAGAVHLDVVIPANTSADIYVPASDATAITESGTALTLHPEIKVLRKEGDYMVLSVGSGEYHFVCKG